MVIHQAAGCLVTQAPAKVNLFFEVLARRADGFHEIETLMAPISLYDSLAFRDVPGPDISLTCRWSPGLNIAQQQSSAQGNLPQGKANIVVRAVELLRERAGVTSGAHLSLLKRIPSEAGLGGGSSDAAAALMLANRGWGLHWSREKLLPLAAELGSDVPFFLLAGPAICRGRGEQLERLARSGTLHLVVARPPAGLSTAEVYKNCLVPLQPRSLRAMRAAWESGVLRSIVAALYNRLEDAAQRLSPWVARLRQEFARLDVVGHQMSGSGTSYFGVCRHARHARRIAARLRARGLGLVYAAVA